jgi:hypothetical protein
VAALRRADPPSKDSELLLIDCKDSNFRIISEWAQAEQSNPSRKNKQNKGKLNFKILIGKNSLFGRSGFTRHTGKIYLRLLNFNKQTLNKQKIEMDLILDYSGVNRVNLT